MGIGDWGLIIGNNASNSDCLKGNDIHILRRTWYKKVFQRL